MFNWLPLRNRVEEVREEYFMLKIDRVKNHIYNKMNSSVPTPRPRNRIITKIQKPFLNMFLFISLSILLEVA